MVFDASAAAPRPRRVVDQSVVLPFAPSIVWHCFVDPVLADGWLAHLLIDERVGGGYSVVWPTHEPHEADWFGTIEEIVPVGRLLVSFAPHTLLEFSVAAHDGALDSAGDSESVVRVRHESFLTADEQRTVRAFWRVRLVDLGQLLRGRPVEWNRSPGG